MRTVKLTNDQLDTIMHALKCMHEHLQYEDDWSEERKNLTYLRYCDAEMAVEP